MTTTESSSNSGDSVVGSCANTSIAAPATVPSRIAAASAASSTIPPRAVLTIRRPGFALARTAASMRPIVSGVFGRCTVRKSASATSSSMRGHELHAELPGPLRAHERVEGHEPHAERERPLRDEHADAAEPDDAERLAVQLDAFPPAAVPAPGDEVGVGLRDVARLREQQRERVLGRGQHVRLRRVHHHHAAASRLGHVDVVEPDSGSADDDEIGRGREHVGVDAASRCGSRARPHRAALRSARPSTARSARRPRVRPHASARGRERQSARRSRRDSGQTWSRRSRAVTTRRAPSRCGAVPHRGRRRRARTTAGSIPGHRTPPRAPNATFTSSSSTSHSSSVFAGRRPAISRPSTASNDGKQ